MGIMMGTFPNGIPAIPLAAIVGILLNAILTTKWETVWDKYLLLLEKGGFYER